MNTPLLQAVDTDAMQQLHRNIAQREHALARISQMDIQVAEAQHAAQVAQQAARAAEAVRANAIAGAFNRTTTTTTASPERTFSIQESNRRLSNAGSNASSEGRRAVAALNQPAAEEGSPQSSSSSVQTPNSDSTDDAYGDNNSITSQVDSEVDPIRSPVDDHAHDPTYSPGGIDSPDPNEEQQRRDAIATRATQPIPPQVLAGQFRHARVVQQIYVQEHDSAVANARANAPVPAPVPAPAPMPAPMPAPAAIAGPAAAVAPAAVAPAAVGPPRRLNRHGRPLQRMRAKPIPGHNFYDSHFIRALPNLTAKECAGLLRAAIPDRKARALKYYRDEGFPIPEMMNSPNPGFAPVVPGSPASIIASPHGRRPVVAAADMSDDDDFQPLRRVR